MLVLLMGVTCEIYRSDGMIHMPTLKTIGSGIRVILTVLSQRFDRLQCWYY
jgi:hypothetical protein